MLSNFSFNLKNGLIILFGIIAVAAIIWAAFFYYKYNQSQKVAGAKIEQEAESLIADVSKLTDLPQNENPTIATVSDVSKLQNQPFFAKAQNGDKVLLYNQSKKAYLYRPETKKIIDIAPINAASESAQQTNPQITAQEAKARIALRNGTNISGLTKKVEPEVQKILSESVISSRDNAKKNNYDKTLVVPLSEQFVNQAQQLSKDLNATFESAFPSDEDKPQDSDILIILGSDRGQS